MNEDTTTPAAIYTDADWIKDKTFSAAPGQEVEESIYWEMFEAVPPLNLPRAKMAEGYRGFLVSEPAAHNHGPLFEAFGHKNGHYYFLGLMHADADQSGYTF